MLSFFFSSRRRHTRWPRDWSSDVCSSDLDAGERTAHLLAGTMRNFTEFSPGYALANITITEALADQPLSELRLKQRYDVTVVAVEKEDEFQNVYPETVLAEGENIIVAGPTERVDEFAKRV